MSHKGSTRFTHNVQKHERLYLVQKSSYFSLQYPIQHTRCIFLVDEIEQYRTAELPEFEDMVSSRDGAMWDCSGLLIKEIKPW